MTRLSNKKVAILATHGFEESELTSPKAALEEAGAEVHVIAPEAGSIKAWKEKDWGIDVHVDKVLADVQAGDYDALVLPGGVMNPDKLRLDKDAVNFASGFFEQGNLLPLSATDRKRL